MGMFTWGEPNKAILPPEYQAQISRQSKDVLEPAWETLAITAGGQLIIVCPVIAANLLKLFRQCPVTLVMIIQRKLQPFQVTHDPA